MDKTELGHLLLDGSAEIDALRRLRRALARVAIPMSEPCKHEHTELLLRGMGFGLAGGGYGAYCYCEDCGVILEKWQESDDTEPDTPQP